MQKILVLQLCLLLSIGRATPKESWVVTFAQGQEMLSKKQEPIVLQLIEHLDKSPNSLVEIIGYSSLHTSPQLAHQRAATVANLCLMHGIERKRLTITTVPSMPAEQRVRIVTRP